MIEEQETAVEEMKSTNEELMSANEELQSINEEMETSKEELQSANEELATLNEELENRNQELFQANNDLNNLLTAVQIAIVMLGPDLQYPAFQPRGPGDVEPDPGRLGQAHRRHQAEGGGAGPGGGDQGGPEHPHHIEELEVQDREGRWYSLRLRPYRTSDNKIDGVILALVDIEALKKSLQEVQGPGTMPRPSSPPCGSPSSSWTASCG